MIKPSPKAILQMQTKEAGNDQKYIVQCFNFKIMQDCMRMDISDGENKIKALLFLNGKNDVRKLGKPHEQSNKYLIQVNDFNTYMQEGKQFIQILRFSSIQPIKTRSDLSNLNGSVKKQVKFQFSDEKSEKRSGPIQFVKTQQKTSREKMVTLPEDSQSPQENQLKNFQKISDLFIDMPGWQIIVRVIEKSYRQFNNKSGKLTKIFSMTLIDRTGMKIQGVMFGDNAKQYHDLIKVNGVYRMSKGQIRQDTYKQNRGDRFSRFNINFTKSSIFIPIKDIPQIPRAKTTYVQLKDLTKDWNFQQQFDLIAILLNIGQDRIIEKEGRNLFRKNLVVGDPQTLKCIQVVIWNQNIQVNPQWLDRTILLKNFKLHTFRDALVINSYFKSEIKLQQDHKFNQYEGRYNEKDYQLLSQAFDNCGGKKQSKDKSPKTIKQLQHQIDLSNNSQPIYSDLQVFITHMSFKGKWAYQACNNAKCKKSAESRTKCMNCGHYNDQTNRRFILPIEITDFSGSIWTTAFDQLVHEIFKDISRDQLSKLSEDELKIQGQKHLYQQFKIKISTKKEPQGSLKHNVVGKVSQLIIEKAANANINKIRKIIDY